MMPSKPSWSSNWASTVKSSPVAYISAMVVKWSVGRAMRSTIPGCIVQPHLLHDIKVICSFLTLQTMERNIPNHKISVVLCVNAPPLYVECAQKPLTQEPDFPSRGRFLQ